MNPFAPTSFRKGNNKLNSLRYNEDLDQWSWGRISWEKYRNMKGAELLQNPDFDKDFKKWRNEVRKLNNEMLIKFSAGGTYPSSFEESINNQLQEKLDAYSNKNSVVELRNSVLSYLKKHIHDPAIFESIMKYWEMIKNLEISGESEED